MATKRVRYISHFWCSRLYSVHMYVTLGFKLSFDVTVVLFSLTAQKIDTCNQKYSTRR